MSDPKIYRVLLASLLCSLSGCSRGCDRQANLRIADKERLERTPHRNLDKPITVMVDGCEYLHFTEDGSWDRSSMIAHSGTCSNPVHKCECEGDMQ